jgi:hypothetical protein
MIHLGGFCKVHGLLEFTRLPQIGMGYPGKRPLADIFCSLTDRKPIQNLPVSALSHIGTKDAVYFKSTTFNLIIGKEDVRL